VAVLAQLQVEVAEEAVQTLAVVMAVLAVLVETDFVLFGGLYNESFSNQKWNCC
jgi:hypothetical protein